LLLGIIVVLILIMAVFFYVSYRERPSDEAPGAPSLVPKKETPEVGVKPVPPPYPLDAPLLVQVRKAFSEGVTPPEAVEMAKSLPDGVERPDAAFLLWEYAAENGIAEAALEVARYYDPLYKGPRGTIAVNPALAMQWYNEALAGGRSEAGKALLALKQWTKEHAETSSGSTN
jgi:TPR repeat protein